jgi:hypothetical protein
MRPRTGDAALAALVALLAATPAPAAAADVEITASADRSEMAEDEVLVLTVRVDADEAPASVDVHEADLPFRVLSRSWSTDVSFGIGGGGLSLRRSRTLTLSLAPKRTGNLVIPPVVATAKGVRHATEPIRVKVTPAGARPRAAAPAPDRSGGSWRGWEKDLALDVQVDRREVFLGEQVTVTVWLLAPAAVVAFENYAPPLYDGFWVEEIERLKQRLDFQVRTVNGVPLRAYALQKLALFPTRAGTLELGAFHVETVLRLGSGGFLSPFADLRRASRRSAPVAIQVKPLPPGAPAGFQSVNVGAWKLEAAASQPSVPAGQPVAIRVTASGEGNVRALALPLLPAVAGARRFEPTLSEDVERKARRLGGNRTMETVLVPEGPGELVVPPLAWAFFDPRTGKYATARTRELRVAVLPGATPAATPAGPPAAALRPVRTDGALAPRAPPPWTRAPFLAALVLPPLVLAGLVLSDAWRRRVARFAHARRARGAGRLARRRLRSAHRRAAADPAAALDLVERALAGYAGDRLGRATAALTRAALGEALLSAGARPAAVAALSAALDACDSGRFGGGAPTEEVLGLAERAVALLEGSPWSPARGAP